MRAGRAGRGSLPAWDAALARHGVELMRDRAEVVARLRGRFAAHAGALGLEGEVELAYRPRSKAEDADALAAELAERTDGDLERGFTGHGPHRDDLALRRDGRELRSYGSRGQVRLGLLALLLAEREELAAERGAPPLLLLDDVMSELDATPPRAAGRRAAGIRAERRHGDRARRTCRAPTSPASSAWRSPRAGSCRPPPSRAPWTATVAIRAGG